MIWSLGLPPQSTLRTPCFVLIHASSVWMTGSTMSFSTGFIPPCLWSQLCCIKWLASRACLCFSLDTALDIVMSSAVPFPTWMGLWVPPLVVLYCHRICYTETKVPHYVMCKLHASIPSIRAMGTFPPCRTWTKLSRAPWFHIPNYQAPGKANVRIVVRHFLAYHYYD